MCNTGLDLICIICILIWAKALQVYHVDQVIHHQSMNGLFSTFLFQASGSWLSKLSPRWRTATSLLIRVTWPLVLWRVPTHQWISERELGKRQLNWAGRVGEGKERNQIGGVERFCELIVVQPLVFTRGRKVEQFPLFRWGQYARSNIRENAARSM